MMTRRWASSSRQILTTAWLLLAVASPLLAAPSQSAVGRDTVIIGISQEPDTVNPLTTWMVASATIRPAIFTIDVQRDANWRPFAQGVEILPNVRDGTWKLEGERMTLRWKIRPRAWHDGRPVTCVDYVFSNAVVRNEQVRVNHRLLTPRIASVSCPKGGTGNEVAVAWKERYAYANLAITEYGPLPRHVLERLYRANPSRLHEFYGLSPSTTVGDGPYRLVEWRKGESLTIESIGTHPIFGTPTIKRIIWQFIPDRNALVEQLLSGTIDIISTVGVELQQAIELERRAAGRVNVFFVPALTWEHIDFNLDNPLLQDIRVRRAIAHGINRIQIVQQLFGGKQPISHTYLSAKHPAYTDAVQKYPYDPARSRALLQGVGFAPGPDGIMRNATGERLSLEFSTTAGNLARERVQQIIQQQLQQVGIEVNNANSSPRVFFGELNQRRKFKAMSMYAWMWGPESGCDGIYTSDFIPNERNGWQGGNYPGYRNPEMDRVCKAASREIDETLRKRLIQESQRIFSRDLPALPLYFRVDVGAAKAGLVNFAPVGLGVAFETWNMHTWYWR